MITLGISNKLTFFLRTAMIRNYIIVIELNGQL